MNIEIDGRKIGTDCPPYIIAEMSGNHNGVLARAETIIMAAAKAGASSVKFQFYDPVRLAHRRGGADYVLRSGPWAGRTLIDIYGEGHTPFGWIPDLFACAAFHNITAFASVFDADHVPLLDPFVPAWKVSSFEMKDVDLVRAMARTGKPMILSTGMATLEEIADAIDEVYEINDYPVALLHCVSAYPCPINQANLARMADIIATFGSPVGFSDHTLGSDAAVAAVALGACIIEKHLTLDRKDGGLDSSFSAEPAEFKTLVERCHNAWEACRPVDDLAPYRELRTSAA